MKKVFVVHGWDGSPNEPMLAWLKNSLEEKGYSAEVPAMPEPEVPKIGPWVEKLQSVITPDENTILVGHSVGCQAVLRYLETLPKETKIAGIVLIAPWMKLDEQTVAEEGEEVREIARPWMETPIDFAKVKTHADHITAIFSDNDPYVPLDQQDLFKEKLSAHIIVEHAMGHFSPDDNIAELPSALEAIIEV